MATAQAAWLVPLFLVLALLVALGLPDIASKRRAVPCNYPSAGHLRFLLQRIWPKMLQDFFEDEKVRMRPRADLQGIGDLTCAS